MPYHAEQGTTNLTRAGDPPGREQSEWPHAGGGPDPNLNKQKAI